MVEKLTVPKKNVQVLISRENNQQPYSRFVTSTCGKKRGKDNLSTARAGRVCRIAGETVGRVQCYVSIMLITDEYLPTFIHTFERMFCPLFPKGRLKLDSKTFSSQLEKFLKLSHLNANAIFSPKQFGEMFKISFLLAIRIIKGFYVLLFLYLR